MLTEVALVVGLVLLAAGLWRRGGARYGWATALLGAIVVAATLLFSAGARATARRTQAAKAASASRVDTLVHNFAGVPLTPADLAHLRWIEGTWRGSGSGQAPFYERYRFADDSTLVVESFADSTLGRVTDVTRFELRGGTLASTPNEPKPGAARWVASRFAADSAVTFAPLARARNSFTWRRDSADAWTATLEWPATPGAAEARRRVYEMRRWK
ncbi:MAG TPA: hypothetical protein VFJ74_06550 [Gemmatimonadaceae bacterium]|nr:hypothetical protein [Gemmatimonadaceae bacterium]